MMFTFSLQIGAWYFSVAAQSKMRTSSSHMIPLIARVAKMLLQSRKCNSASYSDWVIATPPTGTTVYCRIRDSPRQSRSVLRQLPLTKFPHKSKACGRYRKASAIADGCFMQMGLSLEHIQVPIQPFVNMPGEQVFRGGEGILHVLLLRNMLVRMQVLSILG